MKPTIYCFIASILFWNSFLAAFMFAIMAPMLPTMEAKMSTPTRKSMVTKAYLRRQGSLDARHLGYRVAKWQGQKSYIMKSTFTPKENTRLKGPFKFCNSVWVRLEETVAFCRLLQKKELGHVRPNHFNHKKCQVCFTSSLKSSSILQKARKRI